VTHQSRRVAKLLSHRPAFGKAVEVAPYFNPALPKAAGHDVLVLDVFDTKTLRDRAQDDPNIPRNRIAEIEEVDIVGDASAIGELLAARGLAGQIGFVVSSHNFEHLPDPIRFLRGVEAVLMPGGIVSMAIPDCRATFDHFRGMTRLIDWLTAYHDGHRQPSADTLFDFAANGAGFPVGATMHGTCNWRRDDPREAKLTGDLRSAYDRWLASRNKAGDYIDCHVSVVFDAQFALMIEDLRFLGLTGLEVIEITPNLGFEFFAHLRRPMTPPPPMSEADYRVRREELLRRVADGLGDRAFPALRFAGLAALGPKKIVRKLLGEDGFEQLRSWNRARKARRRNWRA
jgi:SAM-dependent methyltransferase